MRGKVCQLEFFQKGFWVTYKIYLFLSFQIFNEILLVEVVHNISKVTLPIHAQYVHWTRPPVGGYKLNFDGSRKEKY